MPKSAIPRTTFNPDFTGGGDEKKVESKENKNTKNLNKSNINMNHSTNSQNIGHLLEPDGFDDWLTTSLDPDTNNSITTSSTDPEESLHDHYNSFTIQLMLESLLSMLKETII